MTAAPLVAGSPRDLARRAIITLLVPVPIALFFWFQEGGRIARAIPLFWTALIMSATINVCLLLVESVAAPRLRILRAGEGLSGLVRRLTILALTGLFGTFVGALIVRATLFPELLGSPRTVVMLLVYFLIFLGLALGVMFAIESVQRLEERARADQELRLARRIQSAYLPANAAVPPPYDLFAVNLPSRQVSGDCYDVVAAGDGSVLIVIADVSGKGVPAALLSAMLQASLRTQATTAGPVARMVEVLNHLLLEQQGVGRFATLFIARLEPARSRLTYTNAGHNPPFLIRSGGVARLEDGGTVVGILPDSRWSESSVDLAPGDRLVLFTDGITEAAAPGPALFGDDRLLQTLLSLPPRTGSRAVAERVLAEVDRFTGGAEPDDDRTLVVLRVEEAA